MASLRSIIKLGVTKEEHERAKKLWEFKKGADKEAKDVETLLTPLKLKIAEAESVLADQKSRRAEAGVAELALEAMLKQLKVDRQAFYSGAFVGEHVKICLYNAKKLGMSVVAAMPDQESKDRALEIVERHVRVWRLLAIVHALSRPSRPLALAEVEMLEVVCKEYGDAFRKTYPGRNVPLKTHVVEYELPKFARRWFAAGLLCEDAAESIHAVMNRLKRRYACVREKKAKVAYTQSALNLYQDNAVGAASDAHHERRKRNLKSKED
jgi:hypothetical protein